MFEIKRVNEANKVLRFGTKRLRRSILEMQKCDMAIGCLSPQKEEREVWVRVMGLMLHMRNKQILIGIGEAGGGILAFDRVMEMESHVRWQE